MNDVISVEHLQKYLDLTSEALEKVKNGERDGSRLEEASDLFDLSERYYKDALHFKNKGDLVNAFSAVNYAHAFLDVGARLGLFKVNDSRLFMVDD